MEFILFNKQCLIKNHIKIDRKLNRWVKSIVYPRRPIKTRNDLLLFINLYYPNILDNIKTLVIRRPSLIIISLTIIKLIRMTNNNINNIN